MSGNTSNWNPLSMVKGSQRFTGAEFSRHGIAMGLAFVGFVALQVAKSAFQGANASEVPVVGLVQYTPQTGALALIGAGIAFIAAFLLGWNNIPDADVASKPVWPNATTTSSAEPVTETPVEDFIDNSNT